MKDNNMEEIQDEEFESKLDASLDKTTEFLLENCSDKTGEIIKRRKEDIEYILMENQRTQQAYSIWDGKKRELKNTSAAAFANYSAVQTKEDGYDVKIGIYISKDNSQHQVEHEMIHALSFSTSTEKIDDEKYAFKKRTYKRIFKNK